MLYAFVFVLGYLARDLPDRRWLWFEETRTQRAKRLDTETIKAGRERQRVRLLKGA